VAKGKTFFKMVLIFVFVRGEVKSLIKTVLGALAQQNKYRRLRKIMTDFNAKMVKRADKNSSGGQRGKPFLKCF
jgi:hypothetical protein